MNKFKKVSVAAIALTLGALTPLTDSAMNVNRVSALTGGVSNIAAVDEIQIPAFRTEFGAYETIVVPVGKDSSDNVIIPKIYALNHTVLLAAADYTYDATKGEISFASSYETYYVEYTSQSGVTKEIIVKSEKANAKLSFDSNARVFIPSESAKNYEMLLPYPTVLDGEGNALVNATGDELTTSEIVSNITVEIKAPNDKVITLGTDDETSGKLAESTTVYVDSVKYLAFTPYQVGDYSIYYTFRFNGKSYQAPVQTVAVSSDIQTEREITFGFDSEMPSTAIKGVKTTLPKATVKYKDEDTSSTVETDGYVEITVRHIKADGTFSEPIEVKDYSFVPAFDGNYRVTYKAYDFFKNESVERNYTIFNVSDTQAPTNFKMVDAYTVEGVDTTTDAFKDARVSVAYKLPSKVNLSQTVTFPAVYAEDNCDALSDLHFTRSVRNNKTNVSTTIDLNHKFNEAVDYTFTQAGKYTVVYSVYDSKNNYRYLDSYTIEVFDDTQAGEAFVDGAAPSITFASVLPKSAKAGDTISFTKPTAIDYSDADKTLVDDSRLNVETYYFYGESLPMNGEVIDWSKMYKVEEDKDVATKLSFKVKSAEMGASQKVSVYVTVTDDSGKTSTMTKSINLINVVDEAAATVVSIGSFDETTLKQNNVLTLPEIVVEDNFINTLTLDLQIKSADGRIVSWSGMETVYDEANGQITIKNVKFTAIYSGEYQVVLTLRDIGNNITLYGAEFSVEKVTKPSIELGAYETTVKIGTEVDLSDFKVTDEGVETDDYNYTITIDGGQYNVNPSDSNKFTPKEVGTYKVTYNVVVNGIDAETKEYVIVVEDVEPEITLLDKEPAVSYQNAEIVLPKFTASHPGEEIGLGNITTSIKVVRKPSSGSEVEYTVTEVANGYKFNPGEFDTDSNKKTGEGTYTVTYRAVAPTGKVAEKTFTFTVGDKTGPKIYLGASDVNMPGNMVLKENLTLTLDTSIITIEDNYDGSISIEDLKITVYDPDNTLIGSSVEGEYVYKLDKVGTYTIYYKVTDSNNNPTTVTKTFEVTSDSETTEDKGNDTIMVVSIVLALVLLGGVIVYFFKPEKKTLDTAKKLK